MFSLLLRDVPLELILHAKETPLKVKEIRALLKLTEKG